MQKKTLKVNFWNWTVIGRIFVSLGIHDLASDVAHVHPTQVFVHRKVFLWWFVTSFYSAVAMGNDKENAYCLESIEIACS